MQVGIDIAHGLVNNFDYILIFYLSVVTCSMVFYGNFLFFYFYILIYMYIYVYISCFYFSYLFNFIYIKQIIYNNHIIFSHSLILSFTYLYMHAYYCMIALAMYVHIIVNIDLNLKILQIHTYQQSQNIALTRPNHTMQLQQSGYRLSRLILSPIPRAIFLILASITLVILTTNVLLMYRSPQNLQLRACLEKYYNLTHHNISHFLDEQIKKNKTLPTSEDLNQIFQFTNSSTLLKFQISRQMQVQPSASTPASAQSQCVIQLNYQVNINETIEEDGIVLPMYTTLGYMMSNYPLFNINLTDAQLLSKHNISLNRIILPPIQSGFRYLGMDVFANNVQDFIYTTLKEFYEFDTTAKSRWFVFMNQLIGDIKKQAERQKKQKQTNNHTVSNQTITPDNKLQEKLKKLQVNQSPLENKRIIQQIKAIILMDTLNSTTQQGQRNTSSLAEAETNSSQTINQTVKQQKYLKGLQRKYLMLSNILSISLTKTTFAKHRMMYRLQPLSKWYPVYFSTYPKQFRQFSLFKQIGKIFYSIHLCILLLITFVIVALSVRYSYIFILTIMAIVGGDRFKKYAGWLHRYTDMIKVGEERRYLSKKLIFQLGFSILAMYGLYAVMTHLLVLTSEMFMSSVEIVPGHPNYASHLFRTFIIIQVFHYIFFRTRVSLAFFCKFSGLSTFLALMITSYHPFFLTSGVINSHFLINLFLVFCFLFIEKTIREDQFQSGHRPSLQKPRMLFYMGYDLDWHKSIPPIWTVFQTWFDLSFANQQEKSYIDRNYELLYGRLMGVNEPQQLPQQQQQHEQSHSFKNVEMSESSD